MKEGKGMREVLDALECEFTEDIIVEWDSYMEDGCDACEVTTQILEQYGDVLEEEESIVLYITLAILQAEQDEIETRIKEEVLEIIGTKKLEQLGKSGKDLKKLIQILKKKCR